MVREYSKRRLTSPEFMDDFRRATEQQLAQSEMGKQPIFKSAEDIVKGEEDNEEEEELITEIKGPRKWWQKRISLRNLLLLVMAFQFVTLIVINSYLQKKSGDDNLDLLSNLSVEEYSSYVKENLIYELTQRNRIVEAVSLDFSYGMVSLGNRTLTQRLLVLYNSPRQYNFGSRLYVATKGDAITLVGVRNCASLETGVYNISVGYTNRDGSDPFVSSNHTLLYYGLAKCPKYDLSCDYANSSDIASKSDAYHDYIPTKRVWWEAANTTSQPSFVSPVYNFLSCDDFGITMMVKVLDASDDVLGIAAIDVPLTFVNTILQRATEIYNPEGLSTDSLTIFVVVHHATAPSVLDDTGCLVGDSARVNDTYNPGENCTSVSDLTVANYGPIVYNIEQIVNDIMDDFGSWTNVPNEMYRSEVQGTLYQVTPFTAIPGINWAIVIGISMDSLQFNKNVEDNVKEAIIVHMVILSVILITSFLAAYYITRDLRTNTKQLRLFSHFYFNTGYIPRSPIKEVERVSEALIDTRASLRSFSKYIPESVVKILMDLNREAVLGGSETTITVFFSDVAQFTTITEKLDPDTLNAFMSTYLENMSQVILHNGGTIDKYIGDAVLAFWNAPKIMSNHSLAACDSALRSRKRLKELQPVFEKLNIPKSVLPIRARIGVNSGPCFVGNFGSQKRFDYTAFGPNVDLSMRLEDLNKFYSTDIIISHSTYRQVKENFMCRPLDIIFLNAGEVKRTRIYELICIRGEGQGVAYEMNELYIQAFDSMVIRNQFDRAKYLFELYLKYYENDTAALKHLKFCEECIKSPPSSMDIGFAMAIKNRELHA
eukprot:Nk52_evm11s805 gene=Nk52_evmTU11s805